MLVERIHGGLVKLRYAAQSCLLISAMYGCATEAYAAYSTDPAAQGEVTHSIQELRAPIVAGDKKSLEALFVGKNEKLLQSYGIQPLYDLMGKQHYTYGFKIEDIYPGDSPSWPRYSIKGADFQVEKGIVKGVTLYGDQ